MSRTPHDSHITIRNPLIGYDSNDDSPHVDYHLKVHTERIPPGGTITITIHKSTNLSNIYVPKQVKVQDNTLIHVQCNVDASYGILHLKASCGDLAPTDGVIYMVPQHLAGDPKKATFVYYSIVSEHYTYMAETPISKSAKQAKSYAFPAVTNIDLLPEVVQQAVRSNHPIFWQPQPPLPPGDAINAIACYVLNLDRFAGDP